MKKNLIVLLLSFLVVGSGFAYDAKAEAFFDYQDEDINGITATYFTNASEVEIRSILNEFEYESYRISDISQNLKQSSWKKVVNSIESLFGEPLWLTNAPDNLGNNYFIFLAIQRNNSRTVNELYEFKVVSKDVTLFKSVVIN